MKNTYLGLVLLALLFTACPDDDEMGGGNLPDPALQLDIVTGINGYDTNGNPIGSYGNPNVFAGDLGIYPNPAIDALQVQHLGSPGLEVINFWIVPATANTTFANVDFTALLDNETYAADEIANLAIPDNPGMPNATSFALNVEMLSQGYYRLFLQTSDERIFWENIYVDPDGDTPELVLASIIDDW